MSEKWEKRTGQEQRECCYVSGLRQLEKPKSQFSRYNVMPIYNAIDVEPKKEVVPDTRKRIRYSLNSVPDWIPVKV